MYFDLRKTLARRELLPDSIFTNIFKDGAPGVSFSPLIGKIEHLINIPHKWTVPSKKVCKYTQYA